MADMQKSGTVYQTSEEALAAYEAHLKTVGKTVDWAAAKNKLLSASMKVLSTVGWMAVMTLATELLSAGIRKIDDYIHRVEIAREELEETTSELESVESELKDINAQIDDILSKDELSITDENDLKRLQLENEELERRKKLLEIQRKKDSEELNENIEDKYQKEFQTKKIGIWIPENERVNNVNPNQTIATKSVTQEEKFEYQLKKAKELAALEGEITEEQKQEYEELQTYFLEMANSLQELTDGYEAVTPEQEAQKTIWDQMMDDAIWVSENFPSSAVSITSRLNEKFAGGFDKNNGSHYLSSSFSDTDKQIGSWIDTLSDDEKKILLECDIEDASLDDLKEYLADRIEEITEDTDKIAVLSISETLDNLNTKLKPVLDSLASAYQDIFTEDGFTLENVGVDMLQSIKEEIDSINKIDGVNVSIDSFETFARVLSDTSSTSKDVQNQFDALASEIVNATGTAKLSSENFEVLTQSLEEMGLTNAREILTQIKNAQEEIEAQGYDLVDITNDEIRAFLAEAEASDVAVEYLKKYTIQKALAKENPLSTIEDVKNLENLCNALGVTGEMLIWINTLKSAQRDLEIRLETGMGNSPEALNAIIANAQENIERLAAEDYSFGFNFDYDGNVAGKNGAKDDFEEAFNWVETVISRIQRTITNLGKTVSATYKKWSTRNNALAQEMSAINQEIAAQQNAYNTYMSKANSVNLSEYYKELVRNGGFSIEDITDEALAENIKDYQEWYDKALECSDAIEDLRGNLAELAMTKFENVSKEYDDRLALIEHHTSMLDGYVSRAEAAGFWVSEVYYQKMAEKELENINQLQGKYNDLVATFNENVSNGSIEKYSEDWYEMRIEIDDVESALQEANTALVEFNQTLQQIHWDLFDRVNDYKDALIEESNFLAEMISRDDLYNTNGSLTDEGLAVQGLHTVNYNAYMEKAADYAEEIQKINEEIANDPNDLELVDRRNELLNLQQESIENAMAEKDAIRDLISDGYDIMLDSLDELINKRKEALNAEKDLYDYQNSIKEKTDTISSYRKQLDAYSGDNSEEARATIQKLQLGLEEAENDLQETEYEKWLSDQEAMLDDLYDQTEEWINGRLDNIDGLISEAITATNENATTISETIFSTADILGYSLSEYANTLWSSASDNTDTLVKAYENVAEGISGTISNGITTLQTVLDSIDLKMQSMIEDLNTQAAVESESIGQSQVQIVEEQNNYNTGDDSQSSQSSSSGIVFTGGTFYEDSYKGGKTGNSKQQWTDHEVEITGESSTGMVHIVDKTTGTILGWVDKDQLQGYATGTTNAKKGLNLVSEMGDEIIQDNDGNIILANGKQFFPFEGGETVFDASETAELLKGNLIPLNTEQLWGNIIKTPDYSGLMARSGNGNVANDIQLNIAVKANNYDEFVSSFKTAIKSDPQCRKLLQAVTVDELVNKGGLSRNRF